MSILHRFYPSCIVSNGLPDESMLPPAPATHKRTLISRRLIKRSSRLFNYLSLFSLRKSEKRHRRVISRSQLSVGYDMTILHEDELQNNNLAVIRRRKKKIPAWANQEQLELAVINQTYFQHISPEDIFGNICIDQAQQWIDSILLE